MPRYSTFPTTFEDCLQFRINNLRKWGHIKPGVDVWNCRYIWSRRGERIADVGYKVIMSGDPYVELDYKYRGESRIYQIYLEALPSNLGIGDVWYFVCRHTGRRCRILYSISGWFVHREATRGVYYESQIRSKYARMLDQTLGAYFQADALRDQLYSKHFTRYYRGKPTRRYQKIKAKLDRADAIDDYRDVERVLGL